MYSYTESTPYWPRRGLVVAKSGDFGLRWLLFRPSKLFIPKRGEQKHIPNGVFIQQQHCESVHAHAEATIWRHAIAHGAQIIFIHGVLLFILRLIIAAHFDETLFLIKRIVQFSESIA